MTDSKNLWEHRVFKVGVTYVSNVMSYETEGSEEVMFLVISPSDKHWNRWMQPHPVEYHALNLYTGERFDFHRDSLIAENSEEMFT